MSDLGDKFTRAVHHSPVPWDRARAARVALRIGAAPTRTPLRGSWRNAALATFMLTLCVAVATRRTSRREPAATGPAPNLEAPTTPKANPSTTPPNAPAKSPRSLRFDDGSTAELSPDADVHLPTSGSASVQALELNRGRARFDIAPPTSARLFRVAAGSVIVEAVGSFGVEATGNVFTVERLPEGVRVEVERGRVGVQCGGRARELAEAASEVFEEPPAPSVNASSTTTMPPPGQRSTRLEPPTRSAPPWTEMARLGKFDVAYALLRSDHGGAPQDPGELLLAVDVALLSRHAESAVSYLRAILRGHRSDARAPMAAFTLGRILLDQLARPAQAAEAFAEVRSLRASEPLAEDALAREVESYRAAGDRLRARDRAADYLARYPKGRRLSAVRRHGGLD